jgi:type II secretory pathway component HofQ
MRTYTLKSASLCLLLALSMPASPVSHPPQIMPAPLFTSPKPQSTSHTVQTMPLLYCNLKRLKKKLKQSNVMIPKAIKIHFLSQENRLILEGPTTQVNALKQWIKKVDAPSQQIHIQAYLVAVDQDKNALLGLNLAKQTATAYWDDLPTHTLAQKIWQPIHLGLHPLLGLELQAQEAEGTGTILSSPSLIVANQVTALIESGGEFPYATTEANHQHWQFKKIALKLTIHPTLLGKKNIQMKIKLRFERPSHMNNQGVPGLAVQRLETTVWVPSGQTITLGGLIEHQHNHHAQCLPLIHHLPLIGQLFCRTHSTSQKNQIWMFLTPTLWHPQPSNQPKLTAPPPSNAKP